MVEYRVPVTGIVGVGAGISLGQFIGEFVVRLTGKTGWGRFLIKAIVKLSIFAGLYMVSGKFSGLVAFGCEVAGYGCAGSMLLDVAELIVPGGVVASAEAVAVSVRTVMRKVPQTPSQGAGRQQFEKAVSELL